jgi:hypothetical protein
MHIICNYCNAMQSISIGYYTRLRRKVCFCHKQTNKHIHTSSRVPLPDVVHSLLPQQSWAWQAGDPLVGVLVITTTCLITFHRHRWLLWRRWMFLLGSLYFLRFICLSVTQLPASFANNTASCKPALNRTDAGVIVQRFFGQLFLLGLQVCQ